MKPIRTAVALAFALTLSAAGAARAEGPHYEIKKSEPKVTAGAKAQASVTIATKDGWHVNAEAPITIALEPPAGITVPKAKMARADLAASTSDSARFDIPFEATEVGAKVIPAKAKFVICQEAACKPEVVTLALNIDVAAAAPEKAAPAAKKKAAKKE